MDQEKIEKASRCLKALSHPIRLNILCALKDGGKNVQELEAAIGTSQSNMSQHLSVLRDKEILKTEKRANQVFYFVKDERLYELLGLLQHIYCKE